MDIVYFDHASTTPVDDKVLDEILPFYKHQFGNANSAHQFGRATKVAIEDSREMIAKLIGAEPSEIIFTSGGTESDNAAIKGVVNATRKTEIITSPIEHHAVIHPAESLKMKGCRVTYLQPDSNGLITPQQVSEAISDDTAIVSLMHVNNEIGTILPIKEIADVCREKKVPFHSDTVQSVGKLRVNVKELGVDLLSMSGHKIYGPKGIGVLYVKNGTPWLPWLQGGSQERRRRGGTSNVAGIVGLAQALKYCIDHVEDHSAHYKKLRKELFDGLESRFSGRYLVNGPVQDGVPHIINLAFTSDDEKGLDGEMLLLNLDIEGICVSNGSACTSGAVEPSHVLKGIGLSDKLANSSIRISFGKDNTVEQVHFFLDKLEAVLSRMTKVTS
ncbi:cysteine desulfurase [Rhodohalobacter sp. SW132]|uniref:cysteine desulfurase family protein n=1 Tax=Rhodohalobacter sp. SW132 TaxID=2293433 RepID=UPI000E24B412|nr:cysteine desulfurase family protein [Rhodohalobacter sp. SW132]REL29224.1 cysteine desulfurase [Rhodohalobacter sp. SW132]